MQIDHQITKQMTFDFDGLIALLAGHLYSEKRVFIRELIQNAHDAIQRRAAQQAEFSINNGYIDILTDLTDGHGKVIFSDNGIGMTRDDLEKFLSTIGKSGTRAARDKELVLDVIGQFGIGFLSGFIVGGKVEVRTRHVDAPPDQGCLWENDGSKDYTTRQIRIDVVGTEVTVYLRTAEDRGLLHEEAIKKVVRDYADMLRIPIHVNDPAHRNQSVNTRVMPWERANVPASEMELDYRVYLERTVPDSVLEVIPVQEVGAHGIRIGGLMYITRTRVLGRDAPRVVRVYQKRMFLCDGAKELLPPWATFVNGILDTPDLSPNAARDNFTRDAQSEKICSVLGDIIIQHFERLRDDDPHRLSEILRYHELSIKSACHYFSEFFDKFGHLLEWRVNLRSPAGRERTTDFDDMRQGPATHAWATLPDIVKAISPTDQEDLIRIPCFQQSSSANQYFDMADAANSTVVDASALFDVELLQAYIGKQISRLGLTFVDRENDPSIFRDLDPILDNDVNRLAHVMSSFIRPGGSGRLQVEARRFLPNALPAVLKDTEATQGVLRARGILDDPNSPSDLRKMAEDLLRFNRGASMRMTINASNELIRRLSLLDSNDEDVRDIMLSIFNDAILSNAQLMNAENLRLFHSQFQRLVGRSLEFVSQKAEIATSRAELAQELLRARPAKTSSRTHKVAFLMIPFKPNFRRIRDAVRFVVEDHLGCELRTADEHTYSQFIHGSVKAHIDDADFFIADITGQNPNVMLELGAALYGGKTVPTLMLAMVTQEGDKPDLPADLQGIIAATYVDSEEVDVTASRIARQFENHAQLMELLPPESRDHYVSEESLAQILRSYGISLPPNVVQALGRGLPTRRMWEATTEEQVRRLLGSNFEDLDRSIIRRVREHFTGH